MKRFLLVIVVVLSVFSCVFIYNYLENSDEPAVVVSSALGEVTPEKTYYIAAEKALIQWEKDAKKNEIEKTLAEIQEKKIGKLRVENPYLVGMTEGVDSSKLAILKEIGLGKEKKILKSVDSFIYFLKKYYVAYYRGEKEREVLYYEETRKGLVEIKLEGMLPAALYGFKTIKFSEDDAQILVAMMFVGDDSWSTRNYYIMDAGGKFKKIYSFEGAWVEERYVDLDADNQLELILQRRLNWEPDGAKEILKELKEKKLAGYNAIFYEDQIIKWEPKNKIMVKAGAIIKADFSHKE